MPAKGESMKESEAKEKRCPIITAAALLLPDPAAVLCCGSACMFWVWFLEWEEGKKEPKLPTHGRCGLVHPHQAGY
jgi:hypothetical protein